MLKIIFSLAMCPRTHRKFLFKNVKEFIFKLEGLFGVILLSKPMLHGIFPMEVVLACVYPHMAAIALPVSGLFEFFLGGFGLRLSAFHHVEQRSRKY